MITKNHQKYRRKSAEKTKLSFAIRQAKVRVNYTNSIFRTQAFCRHD